MADGDRNSAAANFLGNTGAQIRTGGDRAYYNLLIDQIWIPSFNQFRDAASYYAVLAHEIVHWTGAKCRLGRDLQNRFGSEAYAMEELVAEIGAAFITTHLSLTPDARADHAQYCAAWLKVLRHDPRALITAASKAQEAADYIIALSERAEAAKLDSFPMPALARTG